MTQPSPIETAGEILRTLEASLAQAIAVVAERYGVNGKIDGALADEIQSTCYDIAVSHAELRAARVMIESGAQCEGLDGDLAVLFAADAAAASLARLEGVHSDLDLPLDPLLAIRSLPAWAALRRLSNGLAMGALGARIAAGGQFG